MANIEFLIEPRRSQIAWVFFVERLLPVRLQRHVGPFVFFDHMGPTDIHPGGALDVQPHPHIGLSTVTYLFAGDIEHKDSIGSKRTIRPGEINWMTAGRGIAHSERTPEKVKQNGGPMHGLQLWVALPKEVEDSAPSFHGYGLESLPSFDARGVLGRVLAGRAYGLSSPVAVHSPLFYVDASLSAGARLEAPQGDERAVFVVSGAASIGDELLPPGHLAVLAANAAAILARTDARLILIGGERFTEPRYIWWNFVSSSKERIQEAAADWRAGRFAKVVGDETEFIAAPEGPPHFADIQERK